MKRINPKTGFPFKRGDVREDGKVFYSYNTKYLKRNGFFKERWTSPDLLVYYVSQTQKWHKDNADKVRFHKASWIEKNREKKALQDKLWAEKNRERSNQHKQRWNKINAGRKLALDRKYKTSKIQRTPLWLDKVDHAEIEFTYVWCAALRSCGLDYHVDHIVPLQGKAVSGLHVPWNLQVIPAVSNLRKNNRWDHA